MFDQIGKLKEKIQQKLNIVDKPENGNECVIILEQNIENSYSANVGVGKCWKFPTSYDIVGIVFTETSGQFIDSTIKIHTKDKRKSIHILCATAPSGFIRKIDEEKWDGKFNNLEDLLRIIDNL